MRRLVLLWVAGLVVAGLTTCCTSIQDKTEDLSALEYSVKVTVRRGPYEVQTGSGVIVRSDDRGTFVVTNAHVVMLARPEKPGDVVDLPRVIDITLGDGRTIEAGVIFIRLDGTMVNNRPVAIDIALLWSPLKANFSSSTESLETWIPEDGEPLSSTPFSPHGNPYHVDVGSYQKDWLYGIKSEKEIEFGNSGSGVYDKLNRLVGLIWGVDQTNHHVGSMTPLYLIQKALTEAGLGWVLTE